MNNIEISTSDLSPDHNLSIAAGDEVTIRESDSLDTLGKTLDDNEVSPADWNRIFASINDTSDKVRLVIGDDVFIGQKIQWKKTSGVSGSEKIFLSPESGIEIDEDMDETYLVGSYYHACGASGKQHFHKVSYEIDENIQMTAEEAHAEFRKLFEAGTAE
ncbi:MAG: hypothetical protein P1V18_01000 [Candidatus Gracilibacteria bacterium]|nr:hypothetical protein [Candidatus Gracilibacteria bacterium]